MDYNGLINYGAIGICLAYFIWKDNTTMKEFRESLDALKETIQIVKKDVEDRKK